MLGLSCCTGFSLVAVSGGHSVVAVCGLLTEVAPLIAVRGLGAVGFSGCGTRAQWLQLPDSRAQAQELQHTSLVAPWHVGSSQTRHQSHVLGLPGRFFTSEPPGKPFSLFKNF